MDATDGSAFSSSLMLCATAVLWNQVRMSACLAALAVTLGACEVRLAVGVLGVSFLSHHDCAGKV